MPTLARQRKMVAGKEIGENSSSPFTKGFWFLTSFRGRSGDEMQDYGYTFMNARRCSNSSIQGLADFRTKFETVEPEPVFEEQFHGPSDMAVADESVVTKVESTSSSSNDSETDQGGMKS